MILPTILALEFGPPSTWIGVIAVGVAIGLVIAYVASREYIKRTIQVLKDTIESQDRQLLAEKALAKTLAESHATAIGLAENKLETMTAERDAYRADLHAVREALTPLQLELQELKLRPDLNAVLQKEERWHERREAFYTDMAKNQGVILDVQRQILIAHAELSRQVQADIEQANRVCQEVSHGLAGIIDKFEEREKRQARRDKDVTDLLSEILVELRDAAGKAKEVKDNLDEQQQG